MSWGDNWKHADDSPRPETPPTRAQEQERIDTEFCAGRMGLAEWRKRFAELSDLDKWDSHGRIQK